MVTVALLQRRAIDRSSVLASQLQAALNSRIVIEQAKGVLAAHTGLDMDTAFSLLRRHARNHHQRLPALARAVVSGQTDLDTLCCHTRHPDLSYARRTS